jgi:hypothetical protein
VNTNDYAEGVLRELLDFFETTEQRNKINSISLDNFLESKILPNRVVSTIKKGELSIHPLLPSEDIDTVSAFTYLVARTSVSEEVISKILTFLNGHLSNSS